MRKDKHFAKGRAEAFSDLVVKVGDVMESSLGFVWYSASLDVEVMKEHIHGAGDRRRIDNARDTEPMPGTDLSKIDCRCQGSESDGIFVEFRKNVTVSIASGSDVMLVSEGGEKKTSEREDAMTRPYFLELHRFMWYIVMGCGSGRVFWVESCGESSCSIVGWVYAFRTGQKCW